jgi:transposase InsO family protein
MVIQMNESRLATIAQIREFLAGTAPVQFAAPLDPPRVRQFLTGVLSRFNYDRRSKTDRGVLFAYMRRLSGYSHSHLARLIKQYRSTGSVSPRSKASRTSFACKFSHADLIALAEIDGLHDTLSGPATRELCRRAWVLFKDARYERLARISVSHLYNLRASSRYRELRLVHRGTRATPVAIGIRKAPAPQGVPGYIRIDTVHQGDQDGVKGVYYINAVDIVTQWEIVASVQAISESYLLAVIAQMLSGFPFVIRGFHSDNGGEFVNKQVARMLEKLHAEFTKSRPRHSNDNALAECKNGAVIRKLMGHGHIAQQHARIINLFYANTVNPYLNLHRPCFFPVDKIDAKGKIIKTYPHDQIMTPWDRLQRIENFEQFLKPGTTSQAISEQALRLSDSQAAAQLQKARKLLFQSLNRRSQSAA